ncbi:glycosyltransferase family 39 protein [Enterovirga sp.]|uniref:ArnT family glycosyltransferase n=1 Tax=Enterovirga sp. TaxID=2026350 RepID=UPI0026120718|nr:glycosyltransferase family 39 protein [Enterovirga sp.]MDB5590785.1 glycosyl transferase [Enterovirga sp.]
MPGIAATRPLPRFSPASWSERLLAFVERSHARAAVVLVALSLLCFLPGFGSLHPMDRDEPRFSQATKQMLESGDFVDIRFQDEARYKKPIGIHWMQAAAVTAAEALGVPEARTTIAVYRLPSLLGALAAVLLSYWAALAFAGRREAFLAAALIASSLILMVEARLAKTDAMLLACSVAAMGALARVWLSRSLSRQPGRTVAIFWLALAAGILIKGPMVVMFTGLAAAVLCIREGSVRWLKGLRPWLGLLFVLLAVTPWFATIAWKSGGEFYRLAVGDDMLGKVQTGQQNHFAPPGFYLVAVFATFWPGAILASAAVPFAWRERRDDGIAFLIAWVVPTWLIFEAVPTKLPHYVMPLYPALAILLVLAIGRGFTGPDRPFARIGFGAMALIPVGLTLLIPLAAWNLDGVLPGAALPVMAASSALALAAWVVFCRHEVTRSALLGIASAVLMGIGVFGLAQPVLQSLKLSPRLAALARSAPCAEPAFATLGYREPSLVLLLGTGLDMVETGEEAARFLAGSGCRVAIVDDRFGPAFQEAAQGRLDRIETLGRIRGFNINGGRRVELAVYMVRR